MSLRLRLLLGYGYLVALLLLATGSAMLAFLNLAGGFEAAIEENLRTVHAAMAMIEALERQDSATLAALIERRGRAEEMAGHEEAFRAALDEAEARVSEEGEAETLAAIREGFAAYREARDALIAERPERLLAAYNERVFTRFSAVKGQVVELLAINHRAMLRADRAAGETAVRSGTWLGFLVIVALVSLVLLARAMQRGILDRLERLHSGIAAITAGQRRRLEEEGRDELALIARRVNRLLDQYEELEGRSRGRIAQERRLVLGLLGALGEGVALFALSGELLAGGLADRGLEQAVAAWIRQAGRERAEAAEPARARVSGGGSAAEVELVIAPGARPAGWLARRPHFGGDPPGRA